ncbi:MAG: hypothetical protein SV760_01925, partial [Halobacteria archaeon]|nr:hypothetical protein [Halobacteria archaeon]
EEVTFRLNYSVRGGNVTETDWGTIKSPPGSSVGVLDYDSYAEIRITGRGNYTIQLTATSADDEIARDTTKIVIE